MKFKFIPLLSVVTFCDWAFKCFFHVPSQSTYLYYNFCLRALLPCCDGDIDGEPIKIKSMAFPARSRHYKQSCTVLFVGSGQCDTLPYQRKELLDDLRLLAMPSSRHPATIYYLPEYIVPTWQLSCPIQAGCELLHWQNVVF